MSWIQKLYETYDNCQAMVGVESNENEVPLLPFCHTTQKVDIEIVVDGNGNFKRAKVVSRLDARTIIPCTEASGGRTSGEAPHPLCDKLQYIAADYTTSGGTKTSYFNSYVEQLERWCDSEFSDPKAKAVLNYVKKGTVIRDLIDDKVLITGDDGRLLQKWEKGKNVATPKIFEIRASQRASQEEAFVRWAVEIPGTSESNCWKDQVLWENWIGYYYSTKHKKSLCYITGEINHSADQHPAKLRNDGDKAKLISSNDDDGFTFRGRFLTAEQAASVGLESTQKAHFALRWLISRQGYKKGDLAIVAWATSGALVPKPLDDPLAIIGLENLPADLLPTSNTAQEVAIKLKKKMAGYRQSLGDTTDVVVMGLDSATIGRMAIVYYRELKGSDFLEKISNWHDTCAWVHNYGGISVQDKQSGKITKKVVPFQGAPAPNDIAEAAYGRRLDDKLRATTIARILPCIIDGQQIPRDLVDSTVRRACNRIALEPWEWNKTLSIACALIKKFNRKEIYNMALDPNRKTRDYLYGRLLALADNLEEWALNKNKENRETNAARLMQRFAERPYTTWRTIELALTPYKIRLGGISKNQQRIIDEVFASFNEADFLSDKRLGGEFLLGYHCQRENLRSHLEKPTTLGDEEE